MEGGNEWREGMSGSREGKAEEGEERREEERREEGGRAKGGVAIAQTKSHADICAF